MQSRVLMQRYYRAARAVTQINTILLLTIHAGDFSGFRTQLQL